MNNANTGDEQNVVPPPIQVVSVNGQAALFIPFTSLKATPIKLESPLCDSDSSAQIDTVHSLVFTAINGRQYSTITNVQPIAAVQNLCSTTLEEKNPTSTTDVNIELETSKTFKFNGTCKQESETTTSGLNLIDYAENIAQSISSSEASPCRDYGMVKSEPKFYVDQYLEQDEDRFLGTSEALEIFNHKSELADSTPDTVTSEEEQEEEAPMKKKDKRKDIQRVKRELCVCPNCREGEKYSDRKRIHICHIPGCSKTYRKSYLLNVHLRNHKGEKPFTCKWLFCGKQFSRLDLYKKHQLVHTTEKNFICELCCKRFRRKDHLSLHFVRQHQTRESKNNS